MKTLEMNQMEQIEGGDCSTDLGRAAGLGATGLTVAVVGVLTGGIGALVAGAILWEGGAYFAVTAPCFSK